MHIHIHTKTHTCILYIYKLNSSQCLKINIGREFERSFKVDLFPLSEHRRSINLKG